MTIIRASLSKPQGAYSRDSNIYVRRPLLIDECHMGAQSVHFLQLFDGQTSRKATEQDMELHK